MYLIIKIAFAAFHIAYCLALDPESTEKKPNLIMILVDEHNLRTLSCYRELMDDKQAYQWGEGVKVDTPNIDSLARDGAIFSNFYTVTPLCTPSRASFMTGLYSQDTGKSSDNHGAMDENIRTFAQELRDHGDWYTSYIGKFHLNGDEKPGWSNKDRKFGFIENKYQFNRGHWKFFQDLPDKTVQEYEWKSKKKFSDNMEEHYATDFLFDKGMGIIARMVKKRKHFAMVLSITDPHAPNQVRKPFSDMYKKFHFKFPDTGRKMVSSKVKKPEWMATDTLVEGDGKIDKEIQEFENSDFWQNHMAWYFGMVKCIDYNVGRLLNLLSKLELDDDTIVVFTADHGDLLGEHGKFNKGVPYKSSAGIPFLVRYPKKIRKGKRVDTPYSSVDFVPTILSLMGVTNTTSVYPGYDASFELTSNETISSNKNQIRFSFDVAKKDRWAAAISSRYKLVISRRDVPWFYDLVDDPDELYNVADDPKNADQIAMMKKALLDETTRFSDTFFQFQGKKEFIYLDTPTFTDTKDAILPGFTNDNVFCSDLGVKYPLGVCANDELRVKCPITCGTSECKDSNGEIFSTRDQQPLSCTKLLELGYCKIWRVKKFCPLSCGVCTVAKSSEMLTPSEIPSVNAGLSASPVISQANSSTILIPTGSEIPTVSARPSTSPFMSQASSSTISIPSEIPSVSARPSTSPFTSQANSSSSFSQSESKGNHLYDKAGFRRRRARRLLDRQNH